jgi:hypothetical protein
MRSIFALLLLLVSSFAKEQKPKQPIPDMTRQYVVMVFDSNCIEVLEKTKDTKLEVPVDDKGDPIMSRTHLDHIHLELTSKACGRYEIRQR